MKVGKVDPNKKVVRLEDIQTDEVSLVTGGANGFPFLLIKNFMPITKGATEYTEFPKAPEDYTWDADAAIQRLQEWASNDNSGNNESIDWAKYATAFLWYNDAEKELFASYKMPVVDVIDGVASVVWHAVVAAFAALQGAREGVEIPDQDIGDLLDRLKQHYAQFGKVWPLQKFEDCDALDSVENVPIIGISEEGEECLVTGVVLIPEKKDRQGDIATVQAVKKAAHKFLAERQEPKTKAKIGVMHKDFSKALELVESYIMPVNAVVNGRPIKKGSWIVTFRVLDENTWTRVKKGEIRGFSFYGTGTGHNL